MAGGRRINIRERHQQRAHTRREVERALERGSLQPLDVIDFDPFGESRRVKMVFVCVKKRDF